MLADAGVTKSAASSSAYMPYAVGLAEAVVSVEKDLKHAVRLMGQHAAEVGRLIDENGVRINALAESYQAGMVRPVTEIHRGVVDLDLQRFHVGLVDKQAAPKTVNGHGTRHGEGVDPVAPPPWHPENDG
jgi:hypothetical protein